MAQPGPHTTATATAPAAAAAAASQRRPPPPRTGAMARLLLGVSALVLVAMAPRSVNAAAASASVSSAARLQQRQGEAAARAGAGQGRASLRLPRAGALSALLQSRGGSAAVATAAVEQQQQQQKHKQSTISLLGCSGRPRAQQQEQQQPQPRWLSAVRGGVTKATRKSKVTPKAAAAAGATNKIRFATEQSFGQKVKEWYRGTPTITRLHLTLALLLTGLGTLVIDPSYFVLDPVATVAGLQLWRPFTAAAFLGPPSMSLASNLYFLHQYGTALEQSEGAAQQLVFVLFNVAVLSLLGALLGLPVTSNALITAALHVLGRLDPMRDVQWMFSIKIKYWMLPFCLALVDMLQAQNPLAALPAALGILSGHLYYFLRSVWPKMGHRELLIAPEWWARRLNKNNDAAIFGRDRRPPPAAAEASSSGGGGGGKSGKKIKTKSYKFSK